MSASNNRKPKKLLLSIFMMAFFLFFSLFILIKIDSDTNAIDNNGIKTLSYDLSENNFISTDNLLFEYDETNSTATFVGLKEQISNNLPVFDYYSTGKDGKGTLNIPSTIEKDGKIYTVTTIGTMKTSPVKGPDMSGGSGDVDLSSLYAYGSHITALIVPDTVTKIEQAAFYGMASLEYIKLPFVGKSVGSKAECFYDIFSPRYTSTVTVQYKRLGTSSGMNSVAYKWYHLAPTGLIYYEVPSSIAKVEITKETYIENRAFYGDTLSSNTKSSIQEITLPNTVTSMGERIFESCENLKTVNLPSNLGALGVGMFCSCTSLTSITIPKEIQIIPESFAAHCTSLETVILPAGINSIGNMAFENCGKLQYMKTYSSDPNNLISSTANFNLPSGLKTIGASAFSGVSQVESVNIDKQVESIGFGAFSGWAKLNTIILPFVGGQRGDANDDVKKNYFGYIFGQTNLESCYPASQGGNVFYIPKNLRTVSISSETKLYPEAMANLAFNDGGKAGNPCGVQLISINSDVKYIGERAFANNAYLSDLSIPFTGTGAGSNIFAAIFDNSLDSNDYSYGMEATQQGGNTYYVPTRLKTIHITNMNTIKTGTFANLRWIENVEISKQTEWIESEIFYNNTHLRSLTVPFVGWLRGEVVWEYWGDLRGSYGDNNHTAYRTGYYWGPDRNIRNSLMWFFSSSSHSNSYANTELRYYDSYIRHIPDSLESVIITDETCIGSVALRGFKSLKTITISGNPVYIANYSLRNCYGLKTLNLPYIGYNQNPNGDPGAQHTLGYIFGSSGDSNYMYLANQNGTNYYIPNTLSEINIGSGINKIVDYAFANLTSVNAIKIASVISEVGAHAFENCTGLTSLGYGEGTDFKKVGDFAFYNVNSITDLAMLIPSYNVSGGIKLGNYALGKTSINELNFERFETVGSYAFTGCLNLKNVNITSNVTSIGDHLFLGCTSITKATLAVGKVSKYMFQNCTSLKEISLYSVTTNIPEGMFYGCKALNLPGLTLDDQMVEIGSYAFYGCSGFTSFSIPANVVRIGTYAFYGMNSIPYIIIPSTTTVCESNVFTTNIGKEFYIQMLCNEADTPIDFAENWNCSNPVHYLDDSENIFLYEFINDSSNLGYVISDINPMYKGSLSGQIRLPDTYQGIPVIGVKIGSDSNSIFNSELNLKSIIVPKSYVCLDSGCFKLNNRRTDLYMEAKTSDSEFNIISGHENDWIYNGLVFYGDDWQYGTGVNSSVAFVKLSGLDFSIPQNNIVYDGNAHTPEVEVAKFSERTISVNLNEKNFFIFDTHDNDTNNNINDDYYNLFTYKYENNISASTATKKAKINIALNSDKYNDFLKNSDYNGMKLAGTTKLEFIIQKATITIRPQNDSGYISRVEEYSGSKISFSNFNRGDNVWGLETFPSSYRFEGTLSTTSANAGVYYVGFIFSNGNYIDLPQYQSEMIKWTSPARIYNNNLDVTSNFNIETYAKFEITRKKVSIDFIDGYYDSSITSSEISGIGSTTTQKCYVYEYTGSKISPKAAAFAINGSGELTKIDGCKVIAENIDGNGDGKIPSDTNYYRAKAYISNDSSLNYELTNGDENNFVTTYYKIAKRKITLKYNTNYIIKPDEEYWAIKDENLLSTCRILDFANNEIESLPLNTVLYGTIRSSSDEKGPYSSGNGGIYWEEQSFQYTDANGQNNGFTANYMIAIVNANGDIVEVVNDYYELITLDINVTIEYDTLDVKYYMVYDDVSSPGHKIKDEVTPNQYGLIIYPYGGAQDTVFVAEVNSYTGSVNPTIMYRYNSDQYTSIAMPIKYIVGEEEQKEDYAINIEINCKHFNAFSNNLSIRTVKCEIEYNDLSKPYDGTPVIFNDMISKCGSDQVFEYEYYLSTDTTFKNPIGYAPTEIGNYIVRFMCNEGKYYKAAAYNSANDGVTYATRNFTIRKRKLVIDLSKLISPDNHIGYMYYNSNQVSIDLDDTSLYSFESLPYSQNLLPNDTIHGVFYINSSAPGLYDKDSIYWYPSFTVYNSASTENGTVISDVTRNYEIEFINEFEIKKLNMQVIANDINTEYTGALYTIIPSVTGPSLYTVYYSLEEANKDNDEEASWSTVAPVYSAPGEYKMWIKVEAENYNTWFSDAAKIITITPKKITYELPYDFNYISDTDPKNEDNLAKLTDGCAYITYDGLDHYLDIKVSQPFSGYTIQYAIVDSQGASQTPIYSTTIPKVSTIGNYVFYYIISANNYETVKKNFAFEVTEYGLSELSDSNISVKLDSNPYIENGTNSLNYDAESHAINVSLVGLSSDISYQVYYRTSPEDLWSTDIPNFKNAGSYVVYYRIIAKGYKTKLGQATFEIKKIDLVLDVTNYLKDTSGNPTHNRYNGSNISESTGQQVAYTYDGEEHELGIKVTAVDNTYTIYYSLNFNDTFLSNVNMGSWTTTKPKFKDVTSDVAVIYIRIVGDNYNTLNAKGYYHISKFNNYEHEPEKIDFKTIEYLGRNVEYSDMEVETIHDATPTVTFYYAYKNSNNEYYYSSPTVVAKACEPRELGYYYFEAVYPETINSVGHVINGYFEIVPKRLTVLYNEKVEYNGKNQSPEPYVETGTSDIIGIVYSRNDGIATDPIEIGTYDMTVSFADSNVRNYVLVNTLITFEITKIKLELSYYERFAYSAGVAWEKYSDNITSTSTQDGWNDLGGKDKLLAGHVLDLYMYTNGSSRGHYYNITSSNVIYINQVIVDRCRIYDKTNDPINVDVTDKYYDITYNVDIWIAYPDLEIEVEDNIVDYDGNAHTISVNVPNNVPIRGIYYRSTPGTIDDFYENSTSTPITYTEAGEYEIYYMIDPAYGNEPCIGSAKLIINKSHLSFKINEFDVTYDALNHEASYIICKSGYDYSINIPNAKNIVRYYPVDMYTKQELIDFYTEYDENGIIVSDGLTKIRDAGDYYMVIYYPEPLSQNYYQAVFIDTVTIKKRPLYFILDYPIVCDPLSSNMVGKNYYTGSPWEIDISSAHYQDTYLTIPDSGLIQGYHSITSMTDAFIQTSSPNAGIYYGSGDIYLNENGFVFKQIQILDTELNDVSNNYRPIFDNSDLMVEILKIDLDKFEFTGSIPYIKEYDGYAVKEEMIDTPSDGEIVIRYYDVVYVSGVPTKGNTEYNNPSAMANVGEYFVSISIEEGTNYKKYNGTIDFYMQITPKITEVYWDDLTVIFNGDYQAPRPYILSVVDGQTKIYLDVQITYYQNVVDKVLLAGGYEAYPIDNQDNYDLVSTLPELFTIEPVVFDISVNESVEEDGTYHPISFTWDDLTSKVFTKEEIEKFFEHIILTGSTGANNTSATIKTKSTEAGNYIDNIGLYADFKAIYSNENNDPIDVSNCISFNIKGMIKVNANKIVIGFKNEVENSGDGYIVKITYDGTAHNIVNYIDILYPATGTEIHYSVDEGANYNLICPSYTEVGTYVYKFYVTASSNYSASENITITMQITPKEADVNLTKKLDKEYDGLIIDESTVKNLIGEALTYNGTSKDDLLVQFYAVNSSDVAMDSVIDVGDYIAVVTCKKDDPLKKQNFTALYKTFPFSIQPKTIKLTYDQKCVTDNQNMTQQWTSELFVNKQLTGMGGKDLIDYQFKTVNSTYSRGIYEYKEVIYYNPDSNRKVFGDGLFEIIWETYDSENTTKKTSYNYAIELTFKLTVTYKNMEYSVANVEKNYIAGQKYPTESPISISIPSSPSSLKVYYDNEYHANPNDYAYQPNSLETYPDGVKHELPGEHIVYYYIECTGYEPVFGNFTVTIGFKDREYEKDDSNVKMTKDYDGLPAGIYDPYINQYVPVYSLKNNTDPTDDYDKTRVICYYQKKNSNIRLLEAVDAGSYTYTIIIPKSTYYNETKITGSFTISPTIFDLKGTYSYDYTGSSPTYSNVLGTNSPFKLCYKGTDTEVPTTFTLSGTLKTIDGQNNAAKDVGEYSGAINQVVWENGYVLRKDGVDVQGNYVVSIDNVKFKIEAGVIHWSVSNQIQIYDGSSHSVTINVTRPSFGATVYYSKNSYIDQDDNFVDGNDWTTEAPGYIQIGTHTFFIKISAGNNYSDVAPIEVSLTINKTVMTLEIDSLTKVYDGKEVLIPDESMIRTNNKELDLSDLMISYYMYNGFGDVNDMQNYTFMSDSTSNRPIIVGKYAMQVIANLKPESNYEMVEAYYQFFEIKSKAIKAIWSGATFLYDGKTHQPYAQFVDLDGAAVVIDESLISYDIQSIKDAEGNVFDDRDHKTAGTYRITVSVDGGTENFNIDDSTVTTTFYIAPRPINITTNGEMTLKYTDGQEYRLYYTPSEILSQNPTKPYEGQFTVLANKLADGHTIPTTDTYIYLNTSSLGKFTDPSSFKWRSGNSNECIILDENGNDVTKNYTVYYKLVVVVNHSNIQAVVNDVTVVYDGLPHSVTPSIANVGDGWKIEYCSSSTGVFSQNNLTYTNAGIYPVYVKISKDGYGEWNNFNNPAIITITQKDTGLVFTDNNLSMTKVYDGLPVVNPAITYADMDSVVRYPKYSYYKWTGTAWANYDISYSNPAQVGSYKLIVSLDDGTNRNYTNATVEHLFNIDQADIVITINKTNSFDSMTFNGNRWSYDVNDSIINITGLANNERMYGYIQTDSAKVGTYSDVTMKWRDGYYMYDSTTGARTTQNYRITLDMEVKIVEAQIEYTIASYSGYYDNMDHTITVKVTKPSSNAVIEYSEDQVTWSTIPITKKYVTYTTIYVRISAENYTTVNSEGIIEIKGENPDGILYYPTNYVYDGYKYDGSDVPENVTKQGFVPYIEPKATLAKPVLQTVKYYYATSQDNSIVFNPDDLTANEALLYNGTGESPKDAGAYFIIVHMDSDGILSALDMAQTIVIEKAKVSVVWEDLNQTYTGSSTGLLPKAHYVSLTNEQLDVVDTNIELDVVEASAATMIDAASYTVNASFRSNDSLAKNYELIASSTTETFVISPKSIDRPQLQTFKWVFGDVVNSVIDVNGLVYELDSDGTILSTYKYDEEGNMIDINNSPEIPFKIILPTNQNACIFDNNGNKVCSDMNHHNITFELLNSPNANYVWSNILEGEDPFENQLVEITIEPLELPNNDKELGLDISIGGYTFILDTSIGYVHPESVVTVKDNTNGSTIITLVKDVDYIVEYDENCNDYTSENNLAHVIIKGINNYKFEVEKPFEIAAKEPEMLKFQESAKAMIMELEYDIDTRVFTINEDRDTVSRTKASTAADYQDIYYIGHVSHNTTIAKLLNQFANNIDDLAVFDKDGTLAYYHGIVTSNGYSEYTPIGTGWSVSLYDPNSREESNINNRGPAMDTLRVIIFGDMNGNGTIDLSDLSGMAEIIKGVYVYTDMILYYAAYIDRSKVSIGLNDLSKMAAQIKGTSDFNADYIIT